MTVLTTMFLNTAPNPSPASIFEKSLHCEVDISASSSKCLTRAPVCLKTHQWHVRQSFDNGSNILANANLRFHVTVEAGCAEAAPKGLTTSQVKQPRLWAWRRRRPK